MGSAHSCARETRGSLIWLLRGVERVFRPSPATTDSGARAATAHCRLLRHRLMAVDVPFRGSGCRGVAVMRVATTARRLRREMVLATRIPYTAQVSEHLVRTT